MKIKCTNPATRSLGIKGRTATFHGGIATVSKELGEALTAAYPDHVEVVAEKATRNTKKGE
tara:strand:- start:732 stop:914 length:183 start_codon:yes stop_codon:yes gene_type:complete